MQNFYHKLLIAQVLEPFLLGKGDVKGTLLVPYFKPAA